VLGAVTRVPAGILGLDGYGEVRPGCIADLVLFKGEPWEPEGVVEAHVCQRKAGVLRSDETEKVRRNPDPEETKESAAALRCRRQIVVPVVIHDAVAHAVGVFAKALSLEVKLVAFDEH